MRPEAVGEAYWLLHRQPRDAWTSRAGYAARSASDGDCHGASRIPLRFRQPERLSESLVIPAIEARTGARFRYVPVLLGGVFKLTNNRSPAESFAGIRNKPESAAGNRALRPPPRHPRFRRTRLFRSTRSADARRRRGPAAGVFERYVDAVFRHMWADPKKMDDGGGRSGGADGGRTGRGRLLALAAGAGT